MSLTRCPNGHMFSTRKHGNTCPYCNSVVNIAAPKSAEPAAKTNVAGDDDKTMPYLGETVGIHPVTGWLVCIEGAQVGQDYRIMAEKTLSGAQRKCMSVLSETTRFPAEIMRSLCMIRRNATFTCCQAIRQAWRITITRRYIHQWSWLLMT